MIEEGSPAPLFELLDHRGNPVRLSNLKGSWVLLWWYPKASTAG